jgi:hypothetical protein
MRIQFIVVGWHFDNFPELIEGLKQLNESNDMIDVFWTCHKEPSDLVKQHFAYKVFANEGLEDGAYQQALDYLNLDDETILFLIHDDLVIKDWNFINLCLQYLEQGIAFVGNGMNYAAVFDPNEIVRGKVALEWVKPESKYLFKSKDQVLTLRESFICTTRKYLKQIHDFEVIWEEPVPDENGKFHIGGIGNLQQTMLGYKITKVFGPSKIAYLSNTYQDSNFLYECARGKMD